MRTTGSLILILLFCAVNASRIRDCGNPDSPLKFNEGEAQVLSQESLKLLNVNVSGNSRETISEANGKSRKKLKRPIQNLKSIRYVIQRRSPFEDF